jgi:hypothetical protein
VPDFIEGDGKMRRRVAAALWPAILGAVLGVVSGNIALSSLAMAQQRAAKACGAQCRADSSKATRDNQVYSSVKDIMASVVDPSADALWGAVGTVMDKQGIQELSPKTPQEWLDLRHAAVRIIEGGNLLMMPGREAAPAGTKSEAPGVELEPADITALINKKRKSFDAFAKALRARGLEALRAAEAKDTGSLVEIGGRMEDVCESCHKTFWYPLERQLSTRNQQ